MLVELPVKYGGRATEVGASRLQIFRNRAKETLGSLIRFLRIPGLVPDTAIKDELTGSEIIIKVRTLYTQISVDGRD